MITNSINAADPDRGINAHREDPGRDIDTASVTDRELALALARNSQPSIDEYDPYAPTKKERAQAAALDRRAKKAMRKADRRRANRFSDDFFEMFSDIVRAQARGSI